jgi:hypothetical protein
LLGDPDHPWAGLSFLGMTTSRTTCTVPAHRCYFQDCGPYTEACTICDVHARKAMTGGAENLLIVDGTYECEYCRVYPEEKEWRRTHRAAAWRMAGNRGDLDGTPCAPTPPGIMPDYRDRP